jgi:hypothetical protein
MLEGPFDAVGEVDQKLAGIGWPILSQKSSRPPLDMAIRVDRMSFNETDQIRHLFRAVAERIGLSAGKSNMRAIRDSLLTAPCGRTCGALTPICTGSGRGARRRACVSWRRCPAAFNADVAVVAGLSVFGLANTRAARPATDSGEINLLRSLLLGAVEDLLAGRHPSAKPARVWAGAIAERWISGEPGAPLSFELASEVGFQLSADACRQRILGLSRQVNGRLSLKSYGPRVVRSY